MVENATNWTYVDQMREPSGGGILRGIGEPYLDALSGYEFLFYTILMGMTMTMAYQRTNTVFAPLFILTISGTLASSLLDGPVRDLGNVLIVFGILGMLVQLYRSK